MTWQVIRNVTLSFLDWQFTLNNCSSLRHNISIVCFLGCFQLPENNVFLEKHPSIKKVTTKHFYTEFFWAYWYMYWDQDFNKSIGECNIQQADPQKLWLYLAACRCQTTKPSYEIIR